jgi:hypothetical protein
MSIIIVEVNRLMSFRGAAEESFAFNSLEKILCFVQDDILHKNPVDTASGLPIIEVTPHSLLPSALILVSL